MILKQEILVIKIIKNIYKQKNYSNNPNERSSTNHNITGNVQTRNQTGYAFNPNDIPLTTLRELMLDGDTNIGVTSNVNQKVIFL